MEVCVRGNTSDHQHKCSGYCSLIIPRDPYSENLSSNNNYLSSGKKDKSNARNEDERTDLVKWTSNNSKSEKCFANCVPSPLFELNLSSSLGGERKVDGETTEVSEANDYSTSASCCDPPSSSMPSSDATVSPTALKLVSAMKDTREKQGIPRKNLSVTWAPDVNDPIPNSVSHVPSSYKSKSKKCKNRKQKNGGKASRGKKQCKQ